jgi:hypothetical protein
MARLGLAASPGSGMTSEPVWTGQNFRNLQVAHRASSSAAHNEACGIPPRGEGETLLSCPATGLESELASMALYPLRRLIAKLYRRIPLVRELGQIRHALRQLHDDLSKARTIEAIRLFDLELGCHPRYGDHRRLQRYAFQVCSQNGEDGIIHEIFRRVGTTDRIFVEVGVGDGSENNTAFLLSQRWKGFWIDGSNSFLATIENRADLQDACLSWLVSFVTRENITALFTQLCIPKEFDLLSLDIDQNTYYAWEGLKEFRPRVVVVEYNASIPPDIDWKVRYDPGRMWDGTHNFGASLKAFEILGGQLGYRLVGCEFTGANAFFVRDDLVADKFSEPFTSENHYEPPRYVLLHRRGHRTTILDRTDAG